MILFMMNIHSRIKKLYQSRYIAPMAKVTAIMTNLVKKQHSSRVYIYLPIYEAHFKNELIAFKYGRCGGPAWSLLHIQLQTHEGSFNFFLVAPQLGFKVVPGSCTNNHR